MAVKIRLARHGAKKAPFYRVVAADGRSRRDGRFLEIIGRYDPRTEPSTVELDLEKVDAWLGEGAQPTEAVEKLIAPRVAAGENVWFVGHWGFQWYAENAGARPVSLSTQFPAAGDTVVVSAGSSPSDKILKRLRNDFPDAVPVDRLTDTSRGGRLMRR